MTDEPIIEIRSLSKSFGNFTAVNNINFTVNKGDIYGFLGPNGAGKSTTIRMLLSLIKPSSGSISIFNQQLLENRSSVLKRIGAIVEKPDFYLYLTAEKNLEILGKLSGIDIDKKLIHSMLDQVGLLDRANSKVKTFSYGMKQRLGIAQALIHNPDLIILDEPTNGLDPMGVKEIRELILSLQKDQQKTVFLSSHILSEVELIANRMVIINKGSTVVEGNVQTLLKEGILKLSITVDNPYDAIQHLKESSFNQMFIKQVDNSLVFSVDQSSINAILSLLIMKGISIIEVHSTRSLEDYFISLTH